MKAENLRSLLGHEGKGITGCLLFIVLIAVAIMLAVRLGPVYYANYNLEQDVKTEASRAGAHFLNDETIIRDIRDMARKNEIELKRDNIKIKRFAGQVHITVNYSVPIDLVFYKYNMDFEIETSSFVGAL